MDNDRPSALLGESAATVVSTVSNVTRFSLRATSFVLGTLLAGAKYGTSAGLGLSRRTLVGALSAARSLHPSYATITDELDADELEKLTHSEQFLQALDHYTVLGIYYVHSAFSLTELLAMASLHITTTAVTSTLQAADETVRVVDGLFGSTETSRALAAIVQLVRQEMFEDEEFNRAHKGTLSMVAGIAKALTVFACLQLVTWRRSGRGEQGLVVVHQYELVDGQAQTELQQWPTAKRLHHESFVSLSVPAQVETERKRAIAEVAGLEDDSLLEEMNDCQTIDEEEEGEGPVVTEPDDEVPTLATSPRRLANGIYSFFKRTKDKDTTVHLQVNNEERTTALHVDHVDAGGQRTRTASIHKAVSRTHLFTVTTESHADEVRTTKTIQRRASSVSLVSTVSQTFPVEDKRTETGWLVRTSPTLPPFPNLPLVAAASRYMRHAAAAYGPQFMHLLGISKDHLVHVNRTESDHHPNHYTFARHTQIPVSDVIHSSYVPATMSTTLFGKQKKLHALVYYISYDREAKAVVLTLRGTMGLSDVLTDLCAHYAEMEVDGKTYSVHAGMLESARVLAAHDSGVIKHLREALQKEPDYGLILTGHSLGAGVGSLFSVLVAERNTTPLGEVYWTTKQSSSLPTNRRVQCIGFGVPCTMSQPLGDYCHQLVTSIINQEDVVPSLSLGVLRDFKNVAITLYEEPHVADQILKRCVGWSFDSTEQDEADWFWSLIKTMRAGMSSEKLYPPGKVYVAESYQRVEVVHDTNIARVVESAAGRLVYVQDIDSRFGEVTFGRGMFTDHSPKYYQDCLDGLAKGVTATCEHAGTSLVML